METLTVIFYWLKVALGLGFVIFIHELGHFLLAKWNGVKVEKFSIGFGRTLLSYRRGVGIRVGTGSRAPGPKDPPTWGETEYILAALPLGGYVKMLGESLEASTELAEQTADPRAFNNKSVWARMQIITAGVIMNVLLGIVCFAFVYTQGTTDSPARIGGVQAGGPAYRAGLRPGDEIVAIDGRRDIGYKELQSKVNYSGAGQKVLFTIRRPGSDAEQTLSIEPLREDPIPVPTIGIHSASSLKLIPKDPFQTLPGEEVDKANPDRGLKGDDKVVAVGAEGQPLEPVTDYEGFIQKAENLRDRKMVVEVERTKLTKEGAEEKSRVQVTLPPHHFVDFGFRLTPGPIAALRDDSPALKAGLKVGDRITAVDGRKDFDPMRLPDMARASAGKPMKLTIERPVPGKPAESIDLTVTPDASPAWVDPLDPAGRKVPLDIPGLGLALVVEPKIQAVAEGSPAAKAGIKPGSSLRSIIIKRAKEKDEKSEPWPITIELDEKLPGWPLAFSYVQQIPWNSIQLTIDKDKTPIKVIPVADPTRFFPLRGLLFEGLRRPLPPLGLTESLRRGFDETVENIIHIGSVLRGFSQGRVGKNAFGGIGKIAAVAYSHAKLGWAEFVYFLGILSVNLAVLNFLPIPPLDGGQFLFLTAEKIRGQPLPEPIQNFLTIGGLVFVVGLILFINGNDLAQYIYSYFH